MIEESLSNSWAEAIRRRSEKLAKTHAWDNLDKFRDQTAEYKTIETRCVIGHNNKLQCINGNTYTFTT